MSVAWLALTTGLASATALVLSRVRSLTARFKTLERELGERRDALSRTSKLLIDKNMELFDQNVRQQTLIESKQDFIGIVSHQLRTPATEVRWGIEAMRGELERRHAKGRELEYFDKLEKSAVRMVRLIDSLVRLMELDDQYRQPVTTPYEPDPLVRTTAEELARHFAEKRINLTLILEAPGTIDTMDTDSLGLVVENLIENAYEYTPAEGSVTVTTGRDYSGNFSFTVSDTGVGISKEKLPAVFLKFQRSEAAMRMNSGGMGLGLYLIKSVVERHGGTVSFDSVEGKGSTFRFVLPSVRKPH